VLSLGTIQPRKNYAALMEAFSALPERDVTLVIVGGKGWLYEDVFKAASGPDIQDRVLFPGFVDDADLPAFYNLAEFFVFPSLYEGFGLPPLEAMACGTPVITANNSSLPEVVGDAGLLVDAQDTDAIRDAMRQLLADSTLGKTLTERGLRRAREFTWTRAAESLLNTYEDVYDAKIDAPAVA
jgi:glycosyltransferase involved in cell wall biosynthesis